MRISVTIFVILISTYIVNASVLDPVIENVVHLKASKPPSEVSGIWKKKTIWKPRWVKEWKSAKITKPVWRKVWSPVQIREWLPVPKPPPGWDSVSTALAQFHPKPQKTPPKDSLGHDSFAVHSSAAAPLWDPVPYPESQQPPPQPFPETLYKTDVFCANGGCDNSPSNTFNHQQILEIIGTRHQNSGYFQNPEYSETVNHLTRLPPEGNTWKPPQPVPDFRLDNRFNTFTNLPEFLVPPTFQSLPLMGNDFNLHLTNNKPVANNPVVPFPPFEVQNVPRWIPLPPQNKPNGQFVTKAPEHPYKFQKPETDLNASTAHRELQTSEKNFKEKANSQNQNKSRGLHRQVDGDFIQEAQLVEEYHYSEFDSPDDKVEPNKSQPNLGEKEQAKVKEQSQQKMKTAEQGSLRRHKPNEQSLEDNKHKQTQTEIKKPEVQNLQGNSHIQKKHTPNSPPNSNFQQQRGFIKEIFPIFKTLQLKNQTSTLTLMSEYENKNHSSIKLTQVLPTTKPIHFNIQQTKEIYPVYKTLQTINPPKHRFMLPLDVKQEKNMIHLNNDTSKLIEIPPVNPLKPQSTLFDKANTVQLVFAAAPATYNKSLDDLQKTTTTEPYEVVFSSSLLSTTEAVTTTPVIIVTPVNSKS